MKPVRRGPPRAKAEVTAAAAIGSALAFHGITDEIRAQRVLAEWTDLVGARIASRTRPIEVKERTLVVEVVSSAWLHELNLLKAQLLSGLIERLGEPRLFDQLKLQLAGRRRPDGVVRRGPVARSAPRAAPPRPPPATGVAREQIVRDVAAVEDPELRELIARVRIENDGYLVAAPSAEPPTVSSADRSSSLNRSMPPRK